MIRYSLATLFLLVLLAALGCAALVYASPLVQQISVTAAVLILGLAVLVAFCSRGRARAAAASFAFAGWAYLLLANIGALNLQQHLLTGNVNRWLYATLHPPKEVPKLQVVSGRGLGTAGAGVEGELDESLLSFDALAADADYTPDGYQLLSSGTDGRVRVWNLAGVSRNAAPRVRAATFYTISHTLWALLLALLGAVAAAVIYARAHRGPAVAADKTADAGRTA